VDKYQAIARPGTEISVVGLDRGPGSVENDLDIALALPSILCRVRQAEREGIQAVIMNCMTDLGVQEARRFASIPVIGPAEASMHYAALLAHNFSIIGVIPKDLVFYTRLLRRYDLQDRIASIPVVDIPVLEIIEAQSTGLFEACFEASLRAIREDGAAAIVLGFAGLPSVLNSLQGRLADTGYEIPVINPTLATLRMAECLLDLDLLHSVSKRAARPRGGEPERRRMG
jgi:allantoin racemase